MASNDNINRPTHYNMGNIECIDAMESNFGKHSIKEFCLLNAFKYLWRCKYKNNTVEDVRKAVWYLNKYLDLGD